MVAARTPALLLAALSLACAARETSLVDGETSGGPGASESEAGDSTGEGGPCSVLAQDCPAGQKCIYLDHEQPLTACVAATGLLPEGLPCTWRPDGDDCDADSMCWLWWYSWSGPEGTCVPFCTATPEGPRCANANACGPEGFFLCAHECDAFAQNCPSGQKCVPYAHEGDWYFTYDEYKCVDIGGDQQPGEPCVSDGIEGMNDDCAIGGFCLGPWSDGAPFSGECVGMCTGSPDDPQCPPDMVCDLWGQGGPFVCETPCDPLADDCGDGLGCYYTGSGDFECIASSGFVPAGEPCGYINDCAPGHMCVDALALPSCAGSACCAGFCDLDYGDADCADQPGTVCAALFEPGMGPPGAEDVGVCAAPGA